MYVLARVRYRLEQGLRGLNKARVVGAKIGEKGGGGKGVREGQLFSCEAIDRVAQQNVTKQPKR